MELIITPNSFQNAKYFIENNADALLIALNEFSCRSNYYFSVDEITKLVELKSKTKTKIFVKLNNLFFENQINELENILVRLSKLDIDKIFFNDFAIAQIKYEMKLKLNLHYHPDTLVTSYGQFEFFKENGIFSLTLSNELFSYEIHDILKNKDKLSICIQGHGYSFIMHSRWELVSNFQKYINDNNNEYDKNKIILIREQQKVYSNILIEDKYGTHMFSGYKLCLINYLQELKEKKLDYLILDTYLEKEEDYDIKIYKVYHDVLDNKTTKNKDFFNNNEKYSPGFYGGIKSILHFKKKGNQDEK